MSQGRSILSLAGTNTGKEGIHKTLNGLWFQSPSLPKEDVKYRKKLLRYGYISSYRRGRMGLALFLFYATIPSVSIGKTI